MNGEQEQTERSATKGGLLFLAFMIVMPLLAITSVTRFIILAATPDRLPLGAAIVLGIVAGLIAVVAFTAISGTDGMDLIVSSLWIIILSLLMSSIGLQAKHRRMKNEFKQKNVPAQVQRNPS